MLLPLLITILTLPLLTTPASDFATYQFALWPANPTPHSASNGTMSFPIIYPVVYDATFERFIFLSGFHFNIANTMAYRVNVSVGSGSTDGIVFTVENDLVVYYITFWVGVVRRNQFVYMQNIEYYPQNLSRWNFTGIFEYFSAPHTFQFTIVNNIQAYILFKSADIQSLPNNRLDFGAFISSKSRIDVSIALARYVVAPLRVIRRVEYVLVMIRVNRILNQNGGYYYEEIRLSYNTTGLHPYLNNTAANFGIPDSFRSQNGFSGNCMLGMVGFRFVDFETTYVLMNLSEYPANYQIDIHSSRPLDPLVTIYKLICVMEEFYYDEECIARTRFDFEHCQKCTTERCVACQKGFVLLKGKCVCIVGTMVNGVCIQTPGCVDIVKTIDGEEICMACDGNYFHPQPINGSCSCLDGYKQVNGICSPTVGCLAARNTSSGVVQCLFCNVSLNFIGPPLSNGSCGCKQYYQLLDGVCRQICGDGVLASTDSSKCDDGNNVSEDGCSSTCQVQNYYRCNTTETTASVCYYVGTPLNVTLKYIEKDEYQNRGTFVFTFTPVLIFLSMVDFKTHSLLTCDSSYSVQTVTFDSKTGQLQLIVDYTTDMEGGQCSLNITFNSSAAVVDPSFINFTATSRNDKLVVKDDALIQTKKKITFVFKILSFCVLGLLLVSLGHKMIGLQLLVTCQTVYYSYLLYQQPTFYSNSLKSFTFVSGYRELFYTEEYKQIRYPFADRIGLSRQFVQNMAVWYGPFFLILAVFMAIKIHEWAVSSKKKEQQIQQQDKQNEEGFQISSRLKAVYNHLMFPLVVGSLVIIFFSVYVSTLSLDVNGGYFAREVNAFGLLLGWLSLAVVVGQEMAGLMRRTKRQNDYVGKLKKKKVVKQFAAWYIPLFLLKTSSFPILAIPMLQLNITPLIFAIFATHLFYLSFLIIFKPYNKSTFSNFTLIFNQCVALYALSLAIVNCYWELTDNDEIFVLIILEGLIILGIVFAVIRMCRYYYAWIKYKCGQREYVLQQYQLTDIKKAKGKKKNKEKIDEAVLADLDLFKSLNPYSLKAQKQVTKSIKHDIKVLERVARQRQPKKQTDQQQLKELKSRLRKELARYKGNIIQEQ